MDPQPAFPVVGAAADHQFCGMTLRDYFAIRALPMSVERFSEGHADGWAGIAKHAYHIADAMLKAREA